jgi:hypothetical protein
MKPAWSLFFCYPLFRCSIDAMVLHGTQWKFMARADFVGSGRRGSPISRTTRGQNNNILRIALAQPQDEIWAGKAC